MNDRATSGRDAVLGKIRSQLRNEAPASQRAAVVAARLTDQPAHVVPQRVRIDADGLEALFKSHLKSQSAAIVDVHSDADIPAAIAGWLRSANLPMRLRMGDDPRLGALPWSSEPALTLEKGRAQPSDEVGLSHAVAAVAETGTLVMTSGPDNPVTVNFLPENHVVIVRAKDIVGPYETAFDRVRALYGKGVMPRTLNMISGPSRTGDIGGRLVMGAHGPRRMCVIVVRD